MVAVIKTLTVKAKVDKLGGCERAHPCSYYPPRIAAWTACASGRDAYLAAGCDIIWPTHAKHRQAAAGAWGAVANSIQLELTCVPDCPAPGEGCA